MGTLVVGGVLVGMILGRFFKWSILVPACGLAAVLVMANPAHMDGAPGWFFQIVLVTASLQFGYVFRLIATYPHAVPKSRPKNLLSQTNRL
jgi:hypothetical protein